MNEHPRVTTHILLEALYGTKYIIVLCALFAAAVSLLLGLGGAAAMGTFDQRSVQRDNVHEHAEAIGHFAGVLVPVVTSYFAHRIYTFR